MTHKSKSKKKWPIIVCFLFTSSSGYAQSVCKMGYEYQIHILGKVQNPGLYKMPSSTHLNEAIKIANNYNNNSVEVEIRRYATDSYQMMKYNLKAYRDEADVSQNPFLLDGDIVFVINIEEKKEFRDQCLDLLFDKEEVK